VLAHQVDAVREQVRCVDRAAAVPRIAGRVRGPATELDAEVDKLLAAWRSGDIDSLSKTLSEEYERFPELYGPLTENRNRATAIGYLLHFVIGIVAALVYYAIFRAVDQAGWWFGLLLGAFGAGAVAGALGSAQLRRLLSTEAIVRTASLSFAIAAAVSGVSSNLAIIMAMMLFAGAGWVLALSTFNVAVQMSAPRWVVARALSIYQMVVFSGIAAGSWLWGVVAANEGITTALIGAASVMLICAALGRWLPVSQADRINLDPLRQWNEPDTAVPIEPRSGPVVITIEYIIRPEDILEFLAAMAERRRIRRRDGALNWRLLRDLADPQVWVERYETPTWLDYLRHTNRMTQDDAVVPQRLRALHSGPEPPRVRRMIERQPGSSPTGQVAGSADLGESLAIPVHSP